MSDIGSFSVQPGQVDSLASEIANGANNIQSELDQLDSKVKSLIEQWDGEAKENYHVAQTQWQKTVTELRELLTKISSTTREIGQAYTSTDKQTAALFN
ncbi:hypothetical protein FACS1894125_2580 [Actinomycetota bacterium]|nr:hypothetical protein FACS1894125_2580 [Actinomycetota bacterium]